MIGKTGNFIVKCDNCKGYRYRLRDDCHRCGHRYELADPPKKRTKETRPRIVLPVPANRDMSFVYLISDGKFSKIGYAQNVARRLQTLQNATPYNLRIVATVETGEPRGLEAFLHGLFAAKHHRNEWFRLITVDEWDRNVAKAQQLLLAQRHPRLVAVA